MPSLPLECPNCQAQFPTGSRFCPHDGAVLLDRTAFEHVGPARGDLFETVQTTRAEAFGAERTEETDVDADLPPPFTPFSPGPAVRGMVPPPSAHPPEAILAGRYQLGELIGQGGMGRIYRATHVDLGKQVAVKVLRRDAVQSEENAIRFLREARATTAIGHPNIVDVTDLGTLDDGRPFFVMELLVGSSLHEVVQRGRAAGVARFEPARAVEITCQLASALQAAHDVGIVHRDMKTGNVFVCGDPATSTRIKLLDFGIAKLLNDKSNITRAGSVFGTPHYMAPEQCRGTAVDHRADIYALGVIFFEMLTGDLPFDDPVDVYILAKHVKDPIPSLPSDLAHFDAVVRIALAKEPTHRFQTMAEFERSVRTAHEGGRHGAGRVLDPAQAATVPPGLHTVLSSADQSVTGLLVDASKPSSAATVIQTGIDPRSVGNVAGAITHPNRAPAISVEPQAVAAPAPSMPRWQVVAFVLVCLVLGFAAAFFIVRGLSPSPPTSTSLQ